MWHTACRLRDDTVAVFGGSKTNILGDEIVEVGTYCLLHLGHLAITFTTTATTMRNLSFNLFQMDNYFENLYF